MGNRWLIFGFLLVACTGAIHAQQVFNSNISGRQMVPPTNSTGKGVCKITLNAAETSAFMHCTYELSSQGTAFALYVDTPVGQNGTPAINNPFFGTVGSFTVNINGLNQQNVVNLRANRWYATFSTVDFPNGDIRGQFKVANGTYNDHDGDGRSDLVVYRRSDRTFYAKQSLDGSLFARQVGEPDDDLFFPTVDFDGDARSDFWTARYGAQFIWRILNSRDNTLQETQWGSSTLGDFFAPADYDGDGRSDIAVFRNGTWYIIESFANTIRYAYFGQAGDQPIPNDYDRDGKADLVVGRSQGGFRFWYILKSSNGEFSGFQFGYSSDPFLGRVDFDGDGTPDISVSRNVDGLRNFYILRSSDGQFQAVQWGRSADTVKLGDYDGDGRTDLAVMRIENGGQTWYILQSSNGAIRYDYWGLPEDF